MSLIAPLLSLPGKIRKLRGLNAGVVPLTKTPRTIKFTSGNSLFAQAQEPTLYSHALTEIPAPNNAAQTSQEVANVVGPGVINAIWLKAYNYSATSGVVAYNYGLEVLVDGVDIMPSGWRFTGNFTNASVTVILLDSPLGGASLKSSFNTTNDSRQFIVDFVQASFKIPFKSSLVVNLIHYETGSTFLRTSCWVNIWKTE